MKKTALLLGLGLSAAVAAAPGGETLITVYSSVQPGAISPDQYLDGGYRGRNVPGYAMVRQDQVLRLDSGRNAIRLSDVAALIDPTTVSFRSLTDPDGTLVLEQNFEFDLVSGQKLLERYIDQTVTIDQAQGDQLASISGKLLSTSGGLVLQDEDGRIHTVNGYRQIHFPSLPGGLITKPTLAWDIQAQTAGEHQARVAYQTGGMTWWADYNLTFHPGEDAQGGALDVAAWVSLINQSGASYDNARLKLIAGDVARAQPPTQVLRLGDVMMTQEAAAAPGFEEKAFFEFHLYTLGRSTDLPDNSTKQLALFDTAYGVPVEKVFVYEGQAGQYHQGGGPATDRNYGVQGNRKVDVYLEFDNAEAKGLGIPLPAGRVRVMQEDDADGSLEFIGEDVIDHTPKDEQVRIRLGSAFDVVGERKQLDFKIDNSRRQMEETIEITLRNHKDAPVTVLVHEQLYRWSNWDITLNNVEFDKIDARTVRFPVNIAADGESTLRYRVRYNW